MKVDDHSLIKELVAHNVKFSATTSPKGGVALKSVLLWFYPYDCISHFDDKAERGATGAGLMSGGRAVPTFISIKILVLLLMM